MALFTGMALLTSQSKHTFNIPENVMSEFLKGLKPLIPYVIIITLILVAYGFLLDAYLDEFSAPFILPIMLFAVLFYERLTQEKGILKRENLNIDYEIGRASCRERV